MDLAQGADIEDFLRALVLLDLEVKRGGRGPIEIGATLGSESWRRRGAADLEGVLEALLGEWSTAEGLLGHNLIRHDMRVLAKRAPGSPIHRLPVIDTLFLSPIAFPRNPYHHLVKGYKLTRQSVNDPVADARLAGTLFADEWHALKRADTERPGVLGLLRYCFARSAETLADRGGIALALSAMGAPDVPAAEARQIFRRLSTGTACATAIEEVGRIIESGAPGDALLAVPYLVAWLPVAGENSVLPVWVWRELPAVARLVGRLREESCQDSACDYCRENHDSVAQLKSWFGFDSFRPDPSGAETGPRDTASPTDRSTESLQQRIVECGMRGGSYLAILPTGAGKSLCFQLPALVRNFQRGSLTIVLSPLQALMRDQVENLSNRSSRARVAALYGLLTALERGRVLRETAAGDISILYVAPEQLRNRSFRRVVEQREIAGWVFDEAHCLSKWGHDFRPDYLFAGRVIREIAKLQGVPVPPIACLTATAKRDVVEEIVDYFGGPDSLGVELTVFRGGVQRENLTFAVEEVRGGLKRVRVIELCRDAMDAPGSVVVYFATRAKTEAMAASLEQSGLSAACYHAGLNAAVKKDRLERFLSGEIRVICATNAFGMGVDKADVRLVVHADIPGTLENYLQEAGRAGRDQKPARCVLLHDESDVEAQFRMIKSGEIRQRDMQQILRGLRRSAWRAREDGGEFQITSGELLRDDGVDTSFAAEDYSADTKVKTAVSWLERDAFVSRNLNATRVFTGKPKLTSTTAAQQLLDSLGVRGYQRRMWLEVFSAMLCLDPDEALAVDELAGLPAFEDWRDSQPADSGASERLSNLILEQLRAMTKAGLLQAGSLLSAFVQPRGNRPSMRTLESAARVEEALVPVLMESSPDAEDGGEQVVSLRALNEAIRSRGVTSNIEEVRTVLESLSRDGGCLGGTVRLTLRPRQRDQYRARLQGTWDALRERSRRRLALAHVCLATLVQKVRGDSGSRPLVEFSIEELVAAVQNDLTTRGLLGSADLEVVERVLLYLHDQGCILLQRGLAIFRSAMTIRLEPQAKGKRYTKEHYDPLRAHYDGRTIQVHVMQRYAELGIAAAPNPEGNPDDNPNTVAEFVGSYFDLTSEEFVARHFADDRDSVTRAVGPGAYREIVDDLDHPVQQAIVAAPLEENQLVLAGPGSGKTRVIVHRCVYLLRVMRVPRSAVLLLCFNRSTVLELRRRIRALLGGRLGGLQIHTFDSLAMRIAGRSFAAEGMRSSSDVDFEAIRREACELLAGRPATEAPDSAAAFDPDDLRDRLLRGYRHILVDEYQDIDAGQYDLVSAIAGRTLSDPEARLAILAVGDDDQNIYTWRGSSVEFIKKFEADYGAKRYELVENYRSTKNIIAAANRWIEQNQHRTKTQPIRIDRNRENDTPGAPVRVVKVADRDRQAEEAVDALAEWHRSAGREWSDVAVLARGWDPLMELRVRCRDFGIPVRWAGEDQIQPWHVRETCNLWSRLSSVADDHQVTARDLTDMMQAVKEECGESVWTDFLDGLLSTFAEDNGSGSVPPQLVTSFLAESMLEQRQAAMVEQGVFLGTVHQAKGLEFDRVMLLDSGWRSRSRADTDPESLRRLFYVGMTRAERELIVFSLAERQRSPAEFLRSYSLDVELRDTTAAVADRPVEETRRLSLLRLADLFLDFIGRKPQDHPVHAVLARLRVGDALEMRRREDWLHLVDPKSGVEVAALSNAARQEWANQHVLEIRVRAILRRTREQSTPEHRGQCRFAEWEVPIVELLWR